MSQTPPTMDMDAIEELNRKMKVGLEREIEINRLQVQRLSSIGDEVKLRQKLLSMQDDMIGKLGKQADAMSKLLEKTDADGKLKEKSIAGLVAGYEQIIQQAISLRAIDKDTSEAVMARAADRSDEAKALQAAIEATVLGKEKELALQKEIDKQKAKLGRADSTIGKKLVGEMKRADIANTIRELEENMTTLKTAAGAKEVTVAEKRAAYAKSLAEMEADAIGKLREKYDEQQRADERHAAQLKDASDFSTQAAKVSATMAKHFGTTSKFSETTMGNMASFIADWSTGMSDKKMKQIGAAFGEWASPLNLASNLFSKMVDNALELDKVSKELQRTTGLVQNFQSELMVTYAVALKSGASMEEVGKAQQSLIDNYTAFNPKLKSQNTYMRTNVVLLTKLGVTSDQSTKMIDFFHRSLQQTGTEATKTSVSLLTMGRGLGITTAKMASDFEKVRGSLAGFGNQAKKVFTGLAAQSKATGIEMGGLVTIAEKFDTFDTAAAQTAKLNAALGTNLSALHMINGTHEERIALLQKEIHNAVGGNFESLDRYTQLFIKEAMGASSVEEAQRLVNMQTKEYLDLQSKMEGRKETMAEIAAATQTLVPVLERIQLAFAKLAANEGVLKLLGFIEWAVNGIEKHFKKWMVVLALGGAAWTYYSVSAVRSMAMVQAAQASALATDAGYVAGKTLATAANRRFAMSMGGMLIGLLALAAAFAFPINPGLWAIGFAMASGITMLAQAFNTFNPYGLAAVAVLALLAAAFALVFYGAAALIEQITNLFSLLLENIEALPQLVIGIYALAGGLYLLGAAGVVAAVGLLGSSLGLAALLGAMRLGGMNFSEMATLGTSIFGIGAGIEKLANGYATLRSLAGDIAGDLGDGFLAATIEGGKTSVVYTGSPGILTNLTSERLIVDVQMPEFKVPQPIINVYVDGDKVRAVVDKQVAGYFGG